MMHLYLMTRGIKHEVDQFITELQGKYLPFKWRDPNKGKDAPLEDVYVQTSVRPIQLWEIAFPEEHKDLVLATCLGGNEGLKGKPNHKKHEKIIWAIRKALGKDVMPIPEYDGTKQMPIRRIGIDLTGIGIKADKWINADSTQVDKKHKDEKAFEGL